MSMTERIADLEREIAAQRVTVASEVARLRGLEAEIDSLRAGVIVEPVRPEMPRSDAILAALRQRQGTMSPSEIRARLHDAGRADDLRSVTATLNHLMSKGAVARPERGRYLAL